MNRRLACIAFAAAAGLAGAVSAQTLPHRDDPAWEVIGTAPDFTRYAALPSTVERDGAAVRLIIRATVAPSPTGSPNTVVARVEVDCAASTIGVGTLEFYNETQGFLSTAQGPGTPMPPSDPGQLMVVRHVCPAEAS